MSSNSPTIFISKRFDEQVFHFDFEISATISRQDNFIQWANKYAGISKTGKFRYKKQREINTFECHLQFTLKRASKDERHKLQDFLTSDISDRKFSAHISVKKNYEIFYAVAIGAR